MIYKGMEDVLHLSDLQSWKKPFLHLWHVSYFIRLMHGYTCLYQPSPGFPARCLLTAQTKTFAKLQTS